MELLIGYIISAVILLFSVVIHEIAHGSVANALGDDTAQATGRLSLNPLSHIDPIGSILVPGLLILTNAPFLFGWAKPVPVNFNNLRDYWGELKVAIAGPLVNIILALVFCLFIRFGFFPDMVGIFYLIASMNVFLALFNMVPVYPLDGSHVLLNLLPDTWNPVKEFIVNYGLILLMILFIYPGIGTKVISWFTELFIKMVAGI